MTEDELATLIERNKERRKIKTAATKGPWDVAQPSSPDPQEILCDGVVIARAYSWDGPPRQRIAQAYCNGRFIAHARNDTPEDDIDQLLAWNADLQAALAER